MSVFTHTLSEGQAGKREKRPDNWHDMTKPERQEWQKGKKKFARYVEGYEPCKVCGQNPAFAFDSKKPNEIKVITCDHITEKPKKK